MRSRPLTIAVVLAAAVGLAACAAPATASTATATGATASTADTSGAHGSGAPSSPQPGAGRSGSTAPTSITSHQSIAIHEAARILGALRPPAGAHRLAGEPSGSSQLDNAASTPGGTYLVRNTQWWSTSGSRAQSVIADLATPTGAHLDATTSSAGPGGSTYTANFTWPAITGVLTDRWLEVSGETVGGAVILRVDAMVQWIPPRPADTLVPVSATSVTATFRPGSLTGTPAKPYAPVTSTDSTIIAALAKAINQAPVDSGEALPCPADTGADLLLVFRNVADQTVVDIDPFGCGHVTVHADATLTLDGGYALALQVQTALHQSWHLS
jgi:hypothetical protein